VLNLSCMLIIIQSRSSFESCILTDIQLFSLLIFNIACCTAQG
jgi:hypothetical protein